LFNLKKEKTMKYKIGIVVIATLLVLITGCKARPVLNIEEAPVMTSAKNVSAKQISNAIVKAGISRGWVMKPVNGKNEIIATLHVRTHMAKVSIKYTNEFYSIEYLDSSNLKYDGTNIHGRYNKWIMNLDRSIQTQLGLL
jgi:hypothetical protein